MKRIVCAASLALALALSGCGIQVLTPADGEEFQQAWDEVQTDWADSWDELRDDRKDAWSENAPDGEKHHYYKVLDSEENLLCTISGEEGVRAVDDLLSDEGETREKRQSGADSGEAACIYVYCQEKTLLAGEDPGAEREYEELVRFTVYRDSDAVTLEILDGLTGLPLPGEMSLRDLLTFTYDLPAERVASLRDPAQFADEQ